MTRSILNNNIRHCLRIYNNNNRLQLYNLNRRQNSATRRPNSARLGGFIKIKKVVKQY